MAKKIMVLGIVFILIAGVMFFVNMRRSRMFGAGTQSTGGALQAVSADGNPVPNTGEVLPANTARQTSNGLLITLSISPFPISGGQASNFEISLADSVGQAISDAKISLDLTMPSMPMPSNQLTAGPGLNGKYQAEGFFTMRGGWRIEVIITRAGQSQSVFFDLEL